MDASLTASGTTMHNHDVACPPADVVASCPPSLPRASWHYIVAKERDSHERQSTRPRYHYRQT